MQQELRVFQDSMKAEDLPDCLTVGEYNCDFSTLQEAIDSPQAEMKPIVLMDQIHTEAGIVVRGSVVILGFGADKTLLQGAEVLSSSTGRVLTVEATGNVILKGITLQHGYAAGALRFGGGIYNEGQLLLDSCIITNNRAVYGAGLLNRGTATLINTTLSYNKTVPMTSKERISALGCTGSGGGIKNEPRGILYMKNCQILNNSAQSKGGGLFISCESKAEVAATSILKNYSVESGGGVHIRGDLSISDCIIQDNTSLRGAGGLHNQGYFTSIDSLFSGNSKKDYWVGNSGSGIYGNGQVGFQQGNTVEKGVL